MFTNSLTCTQCAGPAGGARVRACRGFTLIELMIAVVVVAILARVALPAYQSYITKSRAQAATADLVGMALALENTFQKTLAYPVYGTTTTAITIPALPASRAAGTGLNDFSSWAPSQGSYFNYSVQVPTSSTYTVTATGNNTTMTSSCILTLTNGNVRTVTSACKFSSW